MINFYIEPGYNVKHPEREFGNAGIDFYIPTYSDAFGYAFAEKNTQTKNAYLERSIDGDVIVIPAHGRANIPSGIRSRIPSNVALEAQNKSGVATKLGLIYGAATVDASYKGVIHISVINTTTETIKLPLGMKLMQFIPRVIDTSELNIFTDISVDEFYSNFEFTNRGEGGFGSTGV